ncbi:MAG: hypothetical protein ACK5HR_04965 [Mycoplasmatales bacterium]
MKNKIFSSLLIILFVLTGCTTTNPIEENQFKIEFSEMNFKENTADFIISGYPNEDEQKQVIEVINDSLKEQQVTQETTINLYSDLQNKEQAPFYGTIKYKNQEVDGNMEMPSEEDYLDIATT